MYDEGVAGLEEVDIIEQGIADMSIDLLKILLIDKTTKKYIRWATDNYASLGKDYSAGVEIKPEFITGNYTNVIQPRVAKSQTEQMKRTRDKAEVFTPCWICNEQNNLVDDAWFGRQNVFNTSSGDSWRVTDGVVDFPNDKTWQQYVDARRLEISCGEAPYLVSRYNTVTGESIQIKDRIGILDRKMRIVSENTQTEEEWLKWTIRAFQSTYGYDYQGDNVLLARENLLFTFSDYMVSKFGKEPTLVQMKKIANIVAWNIWQMDGITLTTPYSEASPLHRQMTILDYMDGNVEEEKIPMFSLIRDWRAEETIEFRSLMNEGY